MEKQTERLDLTEGWEILLSAYLYHDTVKGKTRLNKTLSEFQREGLPIDEKFVIHKHGPYSEGVHEKATELHEKGLLNIEKKDLGSGKQRFDYSITPRGKSRVEKEIIKNKEDPPFSEDFLKTASQIVRKFNSMNTSKIVETIHEDLFIDNDKKFFNELKDTRDRLIELLDELDGEYKEFYFCDAIIQAIGTVEFCKNSIEEVISNFEIVDQDIFLPPEEAGNHHILSISKETIQLIDEKLGNHLEDHSESRTRDCESLAYNFKLLLAKAELNSAIVYDIYSPSIEV